MERVLILITTILLLIEPTTRAEETVHSSVSPPTLQDALYRQSRSYYDYRYGRPDYGRRVYERPRCGRCYDDDDDDDSEEVRHRPRSKTRSRYDSEEDDRRTDDRRTDDRRTDDRNSNKNGTEEENGDRKNDRHSGRRRNKDRHRNDDRDRYRPDYYDRFLRDPYRDRDYDRPYYEDYYRGRRPYPDRYDEYQGTYNGYGGYRRPYDRYDDGYGGYGPSDGGGPHGSFRPWDETYRGQSGWDAGGRGYYFASGRPDATSAQAWGRPEYTRPQADNWQSTGYSGYRDPLEYRGSVGSVGYGRGGYRQDLSYGQSSSGWRSVGRPYRDESGVKNLGAKSYQDNRQATYSQSSTYPPTFGPTEVYSQSSAYGQAGVYGQTGSYGQNSVYGQLGVYGQSNSAQINPYGRDYVQSSSTTQETSYLFQREDNLPTNVNETAKRDTSLVNN
ncbi:uncharacterized protein LOC114247259 isoform X2 [Bombyx mandarina]|uniref:Uncharacterized protein LOC114247259 isoform X1 n=1 Tax=Bombyx mandarina TaxID=7092 RepID=A0A6J2K6S0_BOMMA|nr:uncharacterized protein LOC114247259 isoform X1 [Bombyx mandarina]XP_028035970.1 uncharacterized protein LOC114247259 isoform X2 [Bombyx mandarina]